MSADIVVVGSLNMDLVVTAKRAPEAGETLPGDDFRTVPGGKGANQAVAAAKAGGEVSMIGKLGADDFGRELSASIASYGVDSGHIQIDTENATGTAMIVVEETGQNRILIVAGANGTLSKDDVAPLRDQIQQAAMLILQLEIPLSTVSYALEMAQETGVPTILNAAPYYPLADELLQMITYLIVNESEAQSLSGCEVVDVETAGEAAAVLLNRGVTAVIITLGSQGVLLADGEATFHLPAYPVTVVDSTSAGDSFIGAFAVGIVEGKTLIEAGQLGNAAGALAVTTAGAQPSIPYRKDIDTFAGIYREQEEEFMILNSEEELR